MSTRVSCLVALVAVAVSASACTRVHSNIETHHQFTSSDMTKTVAVIPASPEKANTLEFAEYAELIKEGLRTHGFRVVDPTQSPELVAVFEYGIDNGRDVTHSYSIPTYGQTGVSSSFTTGQITSYGSQSSYSGTTTYTPSYGITGYTPMTGSRTIYRRLVILDIYDLTSGKDPAAKFQATVLSEGTSAMMGEVIDEMVEALFDGFLEKGTRSETVMLD
jgi:Domain of unknown function (DUF4136)